MSYNVRNDQIEAALRDIGRKIKEQCPEGWGFTLMLFNFGEGGDPEKGEGLFYISNAQRDDILKVMKEFIARNEH